MRRSPTLLCVVALAACSRSTGNPVPPVGLAPTTGTANLYVQRAVGYRIIHNFGKIVQGRQVDGAYPDGALLYVNGNLYGTTGGPSGVGGVNDGTIFTMMLDGSAYHKVRTFPEALRVPHGMIAFQGAFYGATEPSQRYRGGTLFASTMSGAVSVLHVFGKGGDGKYGTGLTVANGKLYGTTSSGGAYDKGTIFSVSVTGKNYHVLHSFGNSNDGEQPFAAPLLVSNSLYGTTNAGGAYGKGSVFRIGTAGSGERVLHSFGNGNDGSAPGGALIVVKGMLYGTTTKGGTLKKGAIFAMNLDGTKERILHSFGSGKDGQEPWSRLTQANGILYGTTMAGGAYHRGVVFSIGTDGKNEQVLHNFGDTKTDGFDVSSPLTYVGGTLYGLTKEGGKYIKSVTGYPDFGGGTAFTIAP